MSQRNTLLFLFLLTLLSCKTNKIDLEKFDLIGNGKGDEAAGLQRFFDFLVDNKTVDFKFPPNLAFYLKSNVVIKENINVDFNNTVFSGAGRIIISGKQKYLSQDTSQLSVNISNLKFRNSAGIILEYCTDCSLQSVEMYKVRASPITVRYANQVRVNDIYIFGTGTNKQSKIALLLLHSNACIVDNLKINGGNWFVGGAQIKGGTDNIVRNSIARNISFKRGFFARGDAPYGPSKTKGIYPFPTLSWDKPDGRRETKNATFENCTIVDSTPDKWSAFNAQEARNVSFINCKSLNSGKVGFTVFQVENEDNFFFVNCEVENKTMKMDSKGFSIKGEQLKNVVISKAKVTNVEKILVKDSKFLSSEIQKKKSGVVILNSKEN